MSKMTTSVKNLAFALEEPSFVDYLRNLSFELYTAREYIATGAQSSDTQFVENNAVQYNRAIKNSRDIFDTLVMNLAYLYTNGAQYGFTKEDVIANGVPASLANAASLLTTNTAINNPINLTHGIVENRFSVSAAKTLFSEKANITDYRNPTNVDAHTCKQHVDALFKIMTAPEVIAAEKNKIFGILEKINTLTSPRETYRGLRVRVDKETDYSVGAFITLANGDSIGLYTYEFSKKSNTVSESYIPFNYEDEPFKLITTWQDINPIRPSDDVERIMNSVKSRLKIYSNTNY